MKRTKLIRLSLVERKGRYKFIDKIHVTYVERKKALGRDGEFQFQEDCD